MIKRIIHHVLKHSGLPWLLVGMLATALWVGGGSVGASSLLGPLFAPGDPPEMVNYQGIVKVNGAPHNGPGYFKFAIVDSATGDGSTNYWANDGTASGIPTAEVELSVDQGLFNVLLGDTSLTGMSQPLADTAFANSETYLRVWFSQTSGGTFTALTPNQRLASVPYALRAQYAESSKPGPGEIINVTTHTNCTRRPLSTSSSITMETFLVDKKSATSILLIQGSISGFGRYSSSLQQGWKFGSGAEVLAQSVTYVSPSGSLIYPTTAVITGHTVTGSQPMVFRYFSRNGGFHRPFIYYNPNYQNDSRLQQTCSVYVVSEIEQ